MATKITGTTLGGINHPATAVGSTANNLDDCHHETAYVLR